MLQCNQHKKQTVTLYVLTKHISREVKMSLNCGQTTFSEIVKV